MFREKNFFNCLLSTSFHDFTTIQAAFRNGSLGNYLYAREEAVGKFSHREMENFAVCFQYIYQFTNLHGFYYFLFLPGLLAYCLHRNLIIDILQASLMVTGNAVLVGVNIPHDHLLEYASSQFTLPEGDSVLPKPSPYYGGHKRHKILMKEAHVAIVGRGASLKSCRVFILEKSFQET